MTDLEKIQDQLEKAMSELKTMDNEETQLVYDYIEYSNILVKNLILYGVGSSLSEKEKQRIDYEIKAKRKDKDKNINDWVGAGCFAWVIILLIIGVISWLGY